MFTEKYDLNAITGPCQLTGKYSSHLQRNFAFYRIKELMFPRIFFHDARSCSLYYLTRIWFLLQVRNLSMSHFGNSKFQVLCNQIRRPKRFTAHFCACIGLCANLNHFRNAYLRFAKHSLLQSFFAGTPLLDDEALQDIMNQSFLDYNLTSQSRIEMIIGNSFHNNIINNFEKLRH